MCNFNENPVDCFECRVLSTNYIVNNEEYPRFEIELNGFYKEGSAIDPYKFNNMPRLIEDRMNGREGEKEKMNSYKIAAEKVKTINSEPKNKIITKTITEHAPMDTKVRDSFEKTYIEYGKAFKALERYSSCQYPIPQIKNVIFNYPATIVFWNDGTKTVVKCDERDQFDPEKGITMAFFKKMHGNKGHYFEEIKKWTEKYECPVKKEVSEDSKWHIWYRIGTTSDIHCYEKDYSNYFHAIKMARKIASEAKDDISWTVSKKVPFGPKGDDTEWHYN